MILKGLWLDAMIAASLQTGMFSTFVYSRSYSSIICDSWGIKMISIEQLIQYRLENPFYESVFLSGLPESSEES